MTPAVAFERSIFESAKVTIGIAIIIEFSVSR